MKKNTYKANLIFKSKFWWDVVWYRLSPKRGENLLEEKRAIIASSPMYGFNMNFEMIIADEIQIPVTKSSIFFHFRASNHGCLILEGIDEQVFAIKNNDIKKSKDETKFYLRVNKPMPHILGYNSQVAKRHL